jgi:hypothetical protein
MDPHHVFCPDPACPATAQTGEGNIKIHSRHPERATAATFATRLSAPAKAHPYIGGARPKQPSSW